jgi:hypothetical protein
MERRETEGLGMILRIRMRRHKSVLHWLCDILDLPAPTVHEILC